MDVLGFGIAVFIAYILIKLADPIVCSILDLIEKAIGCECED